MRRPIAIQHMPEDSGVSISPDACYRHTMYLCRLFVPVANHAWIQTLALAFTEGNADISSHIATTAAYSLAQAATKPEYRKLYGFAKTTSLGKWLMCYEEDDWNYDASSIRGNSFATLYSNEVLNTVRFFSACVLSRIR